ncbi:MAG: ribonuclease HII [Candidatus Saccharibacteria bacterium]
MIVGIDEVGRGCMAGPLVAGAVLLQRPMRGLKDSKKLTRQQRVSFDAKIRDKALAFGLGWVMPEELDAVGLTQAVRLAMERALVAIELEYERVIIDGNFNFLAHMPKTETLIKADDLIPAVSAASIIAKVARDTWMIQVAQEYPEYGFDAHVGYCTPAHQAALAQYGVTALHRKSFAPVRRILER